MRMNPPETGILGSEEVKAVDTERGCSPSLTGPGHREGSQTPKEQSQGPLGGITGSEGGIVGGQREESWGY